MLSQMATGFRKQLSAFLMTWLLAIAVVLAGIATEIRRYGQNKAFLLAILIAFAAQFAFYWIPGFPTLRTRFEAHFVRRDRALVAGGMLLLPYIIYGAGTGAWSLVSALKLLGIIVITLGVYALFPAKSQKLSWQDVTVMLVTAVPVYMTWYRDIWPAPVDLDAMARLFAVSLAAFAVLSHHGFLYNACCRRHTMAPLPFCVNGKYLFAIDRKHQSKFSLRTGAQATLRLIEGGRALRLCWYFCQYRCGIPLPYKVSNQLWGYL